LSDDEDFAALFAMSYMFAELIASLNLLLYRKPRRSLARLEHHLPTSLYLSASDILHLAADWSSWRAAQQLQDADAAAVDDDDNDDDEGEEKEIVMGTETQSI